MSSTDAGRLLLRTALFIGFSRAVRVNVDAWAELPCLALAD